MNSLLDSFRNVIFDITPGDEAGKFEVNAKFLGVDMERFQLQYQVRGPSREPSRRPMGFRCQPKDGRLALLPGPRSTSALFPPNPGNSHLLPKRRVIVWQPKPL